MKRIETRIEALEQSSGIGTEPPVIVVGAVAPAGQTMPPVTGAQVAGDTLLRKHLESEESLIRRAQVKGLKAVRGTRNGVVVVLQYAE